MWLAHYSGPRPFSHHAQNVENGAGRTVTLIVGQVAMQLAIALPEQRPIENWPCVGGTFNNLVKVWPPPLGEETQVWPPRELLEEEQLELLASLFGPTRGPRPHGIFTIE
jgi:hypothetical protein